MRKAATVALSMILVFATVRLSLASVKQVTGEIKAVDAASMSITVAGRKGDVPVFVVDKTNIISGKEKKSFTDLKTGARVTVKYKETGSENIASIIAIRGFSGAGGGQMVEDHEKAPAKAPPLKNQRY